MKFYKELTDRKCVGFWLFVWWLVNLLQASLTELANDEAYYHMFAQNLSWGYFDHPPVTAFLVWLGERLFSGELGVRFFFTLLQPAYLYVFWCTIRPSDATRKDGELYILLSSAILMLQLYGFIAVPDAPLLFFTALFYFSFRRYTEFRKYAWIELGVILGLLALSKYHGALVLIFSLIPLIPWFLRNPRKILELTGSGFIALAVIIPHLLWQSEHDWVSFKYHLTERNGYFSVENVIEFLINVAVVFSVFFLHLWYKAYRTIKASSPIEKVLWFTPLAFIVFFTLSSVRGYVQPQWVIVATFGLIWILFNYIRKNDRFLKYIRLTTSVTLILMGIVRLEVMFRPIPLSNEVFHNHESYGAIKKVAGERPVIYGPRYAKAAKYMFYTGGAPVYSQADINYRSSEWLFRYDDRDFTGRDVIIQVEDRTPGADSILLRNGSTFYYKEVSDFHPVREVTTSVNRFGLTEIVTPSKKIDFDIDILNPYPYDITIDDESISLCMLWGWNKQNYHFYKLGFKGTIPSKEKINFVGTFSVPEELEEQMYKVGFAVNKTDMFTWFASPVYKTKFVND